MFFFLGLLFLGLMAVYPLLRKNRITEALWILFFAYWSLVSARNVPLFIIVVLPWIALELTSLWREMARSQFASIDRRSVGRYRLQTSGRFRRVRPVDATVRGGVFLFTPQNRWPSDFSKETFPLAMLHRHAAELAQARVLHAGSVGRLSYLSELSKTAGLSSMAGAITMAKR